MATEKLTSKEKKKLVKKMSSAGPGRPMTMQQYEKQKKAGH